MIHVAEQMINQLALDQEAQIWEQVLDQVQVLFQVKAQVRAQVWHQVEAQVLVQVLFQVRAEVWDQADDVQREQVIKVAEEMLSQLSREVVTDE